MVKVLDISKPLTFKPEEVIEEGVEGELGSIAMKGKGRGKGKRVGVGGKHCWRHMNRIRDWRSVNCEGV